MIEIDDVRRLLATCSTKDFVDRRDTAIIRILFDYGARLGELTNLTVDDFDRRARQADVARQDRDSHRSHECEHRRSTLPLCTARKDHPKAKLTALWLSSKGKLGDSGVAQALRRRCEMAGIEPINPHRFRHTWAHLNKANGLSEGDLMYAAGWKSTAMAHRYGRSAAAERAQESMRRISLGDQL